MPVNGVFYSQTRGLAISTNSLTRVFVQTGGTTTFTGITSGNTIVEVQGVSGQVMRVTDCANGVLFSSNNISGQAILQTNSCGSIIGGFGSSSTANSTTIGGGCNNSTTANFATIGGGCLNTSCNYSTVGGGASNTASGYGSTIGGGRCNSAAGIDSTIGGGICNTSSCYYSTIGGGRFNSAAGIDSTIGGGQCNTSSGYGSTIGGGQCNTSSGYRSTVGGGCCNTSSGFHSTVGGGSSNANAACYSTIGGGRDNRVCSTSDNTTIGGGRGNYMDLSNTYSTIGGGFGNCILSSSQCSTIIGGRGNSISNSNRSSILGGYANTINGYYNSFIIGSGIAATASNYSFMNNLSVAGNFTATGTKSFKIKHPNKEKENTHYLVHSVIETPTAGDNLYRYIVESDGIESVKIMLPDYFGYLNKDIQIWVNSSDNFGNGYGVIDKELKIVEVFTNVKGYYNVLIIGTRKDKGVSEWKGPEIEKIKK
jgi:hypothetical protein